MGCGASTAVPSELLTHSQQLRSGTATLKLIVAGDQAAGKSCLARRWVNDEFEPKHEATIGCAFMSKTVPVRLPSSLRPGEDEDRSVQIHLWDTAGEERFHAVAKSFFRGARGAILVYDITKEGAMDGLSVWAEMVKAEAPTAVLLVVGTKADLEASRGVDREEAALVAERLGAVAHVEVSALTGDGVDEAFELAAQKIASQLAG